MCPGCRQPREPCHCEHCRGRDPRYQWSPPEIAFWLEGAENPADVLEALRAMEMRAAHYDREQAELRDRERLIREGLQEERDAPTTRQQTHPLAVNRRTH